MESKKLLYQIRLGIDEVTSKNIRKKIKVEDYETILSILAKYSATLVCQYDAFNNFIKECELAKDVNNPLYKWTRDTVNNQTKKKKYLRSFTIYVENNQLYEKKIADDIERELIKLNSKNINSINKYNSDPKKNPQPPKKYF